MMADGCAPTSNAPTDETEPDMSPDKRTLNLAAAVLCGVGSGISLMSALFGRNRGGGAVLPSLLGLAGSIAWAVDERCAPGKSASSPTNSCAP